MQTRLTDQAAQNSGLSQAELERLSTVARQAATAGALELKRLFGRLERIREKGRAGDLVTEADVAAEQAVLTVLSEATPELGCWPRRAAARKGRAVTCSGALTLSMGRRTMPMAIRSSERPSA